jgi:hypothetical protein
MQPQTAAREPHRTKESPDKELADKRESASYADHNRAPESPLAPIGERKQETGE